MVNQRRGEIEARFDGTTYRLVLTLGALAELEAAFGADDMGALATRFASGRISARDCMRVIGAGLRGAGFDVADETVAAMRCEGGAAGYVDIVARLLAATFGGKVDGRDAAPAPGIGEARGTTGAGVQSGGEARGTVPFPGTP